MENFKKYYSSVSLLNKTPLDETKYLSALAVIEWQLTLDFSRDKSNTKKSETSIFSNITNVENLFCTLLKNLENYNDTSKNFLCVLYLACKHLLKKLKVEFHINIGKSIIHIAEKAFAEKNWVVLETCVKCLTFFESKEWNSVLQDEQRRSSVLKIFQSSISLGKEELHEKSKQELSVFKILWIDVFNNILKTDILKNDVIQKPQQWFMLLFPLLFDENCEVRKVACRTFSFLKDRYPDVSCKLLYVCPDLREQLKKSYSKSLVQYAKTNEPDWVNLWCLMLNLLGSEFSSKKNTDVINYLLEVEETAFRSPNMNTRYNAFVGWKFLVNRFLETSLEDSSRRLKLLMQPLIASNSKTVEIFTIKFEVWWQLIVGIEPCLERHVTNVLFHFLNFCFGPVSDVSCVNSVRGNCELPPSTLLTSRRTPTSNSSNYPLVTSRRMRCLDLKRADALAQILNLNTDSNKTEFKLQHFKAAIIAKPRMFLSLSKMLIHCVGECTIIIVESMEMPTQERKFYLKEMWRSLLLHIQSVVKMCSPTNNGQDSLEKTEKTEMMKNLFRILLKLNEMSSEYQHFAYVCLNPVLETVLSPENGLSEEILSSRSYYIGTEDLVMGTPLLTMLDILLSPACLNIRPQSNEHKHQSDVLYMVLLQRVLHLGIGPSDLTILFTQAVMKRIDAAVSNMPVERNKMKSIWIMVAKLLTSGYVGLGRDINQGIPQKSDFSWLMSVLVFPMNYTQIFVTDQEMIVKIWGQLFQAFQENVFTSSCSVIGNEICDTLCGKVQQEISRKKSLKNDELLLISNLVTCAIEHIPFDSLNKIIGGFASESEKLNNVQHCFQLLQTLSTEIQKLEKQDDVYISIVSQFIKCCQVFCNHLRGCPIQILSGFFVEQLQYILSIKIDNVTSSSKIFSMLRLKIWTSFLNVFINDLLHNFYKTNNLKLVRVLTPLLNSTFNLSDHSIHEVTIHFGVAEDISLQINSDCSKCRILQEKMKQGNSSMGLINPSSEGKSNLMFLERCLTHHQREMLKQRRDDIPALYQDLTQDSQPSFCDTSQDMLLLPDTRSTKCISTTTEVEFKSPPSPKDSTFQLRGNVVSFSKQCVPVSHVQGNSLVETKLKSSVKDTSGDLQANSVNDSKLVNVPKPKKDKNLLINHSKSPEAAVINSSEIPIALQNQNEKEEPETPQKTILVITRTAQKTLNSSTTNIALNSVKESTHESNISTNLNKCMLPKGADTKCSNSPAETHTVKELPIRMCISKLNTGNPEVKNIIIDISHPNLEGFSDGGNAELPVSNCSDTLKETKVKSNKEQKCEDNLNQSPKETCISEPCGITKTKSSGRNSKKRGIGKSLNVMVENKECIDVSPEKKEISGHELNNHVDNSIEPKKYTKSIDDIALPKERHSSNDQSPIKEIQNINVAASNGKLVVSPARVVLKRLEMGDVCNSTCRSLLFEENETPKKNEKLIKLTPNNHDVESECNDPNKMKFVDQMSNSNSIVQQQQPKELTSTNLKEISSSKISPVQQLPIQKLSPKEIKSIKSEVYNTRSKSPYAEQNKTQPKESSMFRCTRTYEKRFSTSKTEQNQSQTKKNSQKESVDVQNLDNKRVETSAIIDHEPQNSPKVVQSSLTASNVTISENNLEVLEVTSAVTDAVQKSERNETKENVLEEEIIQSRGFDTKIHDSVSKSSSVNQSTQNIDENLQTFEDFNFKHQNGPEKITIITDKIEEKEPQSTGKMNHLKSSSPKINQNLTKSSPTKAHGSKYLQKDVATAISSEETHEIKKNEQLLENETSDGNGESGEGMDVTNLKSVNIIHVHHNYSKWSPIIATSDHGEEGLTIAAVELEPEQETPKESTVDCNTHSETKEIGEFKNESPKLSSSSSSICTTEDAFLQTNLAEPGDEIEVKDVSQVNAFINEEYTPLISCNKGEYVRQLSLMPQTSNVSNCPKTHRISTRSDWARRFGSKSDGEGSKNIDNMTEKHDHVSDYENTELDSSSDLTGSIDSLDEDVIESSQGSKDPPPSPKTKECLVLVSKLPIVPGQILNGIEGTLLVTDEIHSGSFRVVKQIKDAENNNPIEDVIEQGQVLKNTETSEKTVESLINTSNLGLELVEEVFVDDPKTANPSSPSENKMKNIDIKFNKEIDCEEIAVEKDTSMSTFSVCIKKLEEQKIDVALSPKNEKMREDGNNFESNNNNISILEVSSKDKKRKRKRKSDIFESNYKKRRLIKPISNEDYKSMEDTYDSPVDCEDLEPEPQNEDEIKKLLPTDFSTSVNTMVNDSPGKIKTMRCKHLPKSEESSPSRRHLSGRAAHLVGLALTKRMLNKDVGILGTNEVGVEEIEHDIVFSFKSDGQEEKLPWIKHVPQSEASPGKTNLKRKLLNVEEVNAMIPMKKNVRFSHPEVTTKLHFRKKIPNEFFSEPKNTYRVVRTKKGKIYVQKNTSVSRERLYNEDGTTEPKPIWPSLKDCQYPVTDIIDELAASMDLRSALTMKCISTIGELCSLPEEDIKELPIKEPKIIMFKLILRAYEVKIGLKNSEVIGQPQAQLATCPGYIASGDLKASLSSMTPTAVINLLRETMSESDLKMIASNVVPNSSKSLGVTTENIIPVAETSTDEDNAQHFEQCVPETLNKASGENEKRKLISKILQILFKHSNVSYVLKEVREVISAFNFDNSCGSESVNVNSVNQCFELLRFFCIKSALPEESARELYRDILKQLSLPTILSELLRYAEAEREPSIFVKELVDHVKTELCTKPESAAIVFERLIEGENFSLATQHLTAEELIPLVIKQCGELTVLDNIFSKSSVSFEKVMEMAAVHLSLDDVEKRNFMNTVFKLARFRHMEKSKCIKFTSILNNFMEIIDCE